VLEEGRASFRASLSDLSQAAERLPRRVLAEDGQGHILVAHSTVLLHEAREMMGNLGLLSAEEAAPTVPQGPSALLKAVPSWQRADAKARLVEEFQVSGD